MLGFDGGCMRCSELARHIEVEVGDKLEIRSLRDPQVRHWRRTALGENVLWAPTLIEIEGSKVRAWTGRKMGLHLARFLGPVATWRVMQVLGELGLANKIEELPTAKAVAGLTRRQFLKGVGGAALAMSMLSGSALLPAVAKAQEPRSSGSLSERLKAKRIAEASTQYKKLEEELEHATDNPAASLDIDSDNVKVRGDSAAVVASMEYGKYGKVGAVAYFFVDLRKEALTYYIHRVSTRNNKEYEVTEYDNGKRLARMFVGDNYVILSDGRRISHKQLKKETKKLKKESEATAQDTCSSCLSGNQLFCDLVAATECTVLGVVPKIGVALGGVCGYLVVYSDHVGAGCVGYANSSCIEECG